MVYLMIKNNEIKDIILNETYKNINIYEIIPTIDPYMNHIKFVFINNKLNYIRSKDNKEIKYCIDGIKSFLFLGIYEEDKKANKIRNDFILLAQNESTKNKLKIEKLIL